MGFLAGLVENSKKIGRILALSIILCVSGIISIIGVVADPTTAKDVLQDWLKLAGIALTFYFLVTPKGK